MKFTRELLLSRLRPRANSHSSVGEIDHTSLRRSLLLVTSHGSMTHTFIHLVPIKDQWRGLFIDVLNMGGKNLKTNSRLLLPRKRVVRAEFNTCERSRTGCFRTQS